MQEKVALLDRYLNSLIERQAVVSGGRFDQQGGEPSEAALTPTERRAFVEDVLRPT